MFRIIRRAPWIAVGAAAVYFMDSANGPTRRRETTDRLRSWIEQLTHQLRGTAPEPVGFAEAEMAETMPGSAMSGSVEPVDPTGPAVSTIRSGAFGAA